MATSIAGQSAIALENLQPDRAPDRAQRDQGLPRGPVAAAAGAAAWPTAAARSARPATGPTRLQAAPRSGGGDAVAGGGRPRARGERRPRASRVVFRPPRRRRPRAVRLGSGDEPTALARLREMHVGLNRDHPLAIGLSHRCEGPASFATGFEEAQQAVTAAAVISPEPGVVTSMTSAPTSTCCACPRTAAPATTAATR